MEKTLLKYAKQFQKLRINKTKKNGESPHKPILLLAVIDCFEQEIFNTNQILIIPELVAAFKNRWSELVKNPVHNERFTLPFFHLKSSSFWKLVPKKGYENILQTSSVNSISKLTNSVNYAEINDDLFLLLMDFNSREVLKQVLLNRYFPNHPQLSESKYIFDNFKNQILEDLEAVYKTKIDLEDEEQNFIRGGFFKKIVPQIYSFKCCISELSISVTSNVSMIDACHIIPFSISGNDKVTNGISLCPNLHRAFDRGLISINENYEVVTSKAFVEIGNSDYGIKIFEGKKILLPNNTKYHPNKDYLNWHQKNVFLR